MQNLLQTLLTPPIALAQRTKAPKSAIRKVFDQIPGLNAERLQQGLAPVISLAIGEPHLPANPLVLKALAEFLQTPDAANAFRYSPAQGRPETLAAIVQLYKHYYPTVKYSTAEVMVTNGASQALMNAFSILIDQGDAVLLFEPYFSTYKSQIETLGGTAVTIPTRATGFRPAAKQLREALTLQTNAKMIVLNYPNNPSGIALSRAEVLELAQVLREFPQMVIVIDDVYRELNFAEHVTLLDVAPDLQARCIVMNSGAKGLAGAPDLRVGMVSAKQEWITAMSGQQLNSVSGVSYLTQKALIAAVHAQLSNAPEFQQWASTAKETYRLNVEWMRDQFQQLGLKVVPSSGGFFLLVDASALLAQLIPDVALQEKIGATHFRNDSDIVLYLLHAAGVAVVPGSGFGIDDSAGYFRVSCAKDMSDLTLAMQNVKLAISAILKLNQQLQPTPVVVSGFKDMLKASVYTMPANKVWDTKQESVLAAEYKK